MAYVHGSVNEMSKLYLANEKRYNYTTPKSFLELVSCQYCSFIYSHIQNVSTFTEHTIFPKINLYRNLLTKKHGELTGNMERLEGGLEKLKSTSAQV